MQLQGTEEKMYSDKFSKINTVRKGGQSRVWTKPGQSLMVITVNHSKKSRVTSASTKYIKANQYVMLAWPFSSLPCGPRMAVVPLTRSMCRWEMGTGGQLLNTVFKILTFLFLLTLQDSNTDSHAIIVCCVLLKLDFIYICAKVFS